MTFSSEAFEATGHVRAGTGAVPDLAGGEPTVINGCRGVHRRRNVARRHEAEAPGDAGQVSAEQEVICAERHREVAAALASLPRRRREVLVLRYYLELSEAEIAETLNISTGTVKSSAARGLATLAKTLREGQ